MDLLVAVPRILLNAKVYPESTGPNALALARVCQRVAKAAGEPIGLAPPVTDLSLLGGKAFSHVPLWAQHIDANLPGIGTGSVTAQMAKLAGAQGTLLNHAEHKMPPAIIASTHAAARAAKLDTLLCADSLSEARSLAALKPTAIAIEPPELIGGSVSVTTADPAIVRDAVRTVRKISPRTFVLCGAGVKTSDDVRLALDLGAHGVLLASGVVKAKDPAKALRDLLTGLD